jgi:hypothetical protein
MAIFFSGLKSLDTAYTWKMATEVVIGDEVPTWEGESVVMD